MNKCNKCYHNKVCLDSANYKNAEKCSQFKDKSLIVELPCRVWDTVYYIKTLQDGNFTRVVSGEKVKQIAINSYGIFLVVDYCHTLDCRDFNKTIFLTREEAEQALKERDSNA